MASTYYLRRLAQTVITFFSGMFLTYALYRMVPGGPLEYMRQRIITEHTEDGQPPPEEEINQLTEQATGINPDNGIIEGYVAYMEEVVLHGNFGESIMLNQEPVFDVLFQALPWSMFISIFGLLGGFAMTVMFGTLMAWKEGSKLDKGLTVFILIVQSTPYYVVALLMLTYLGFDGPFPDGHRYDSAVASPGFNLDFMISVIQHAALPILSGFVVGFGAGAIGMRSLGVRVVGAEYLRSARIRGISTNRILTRYIGRNTILPLYTGLMIGIAGIFGGNIILEQIFSYRGIGMIMFEAVQMPDYPLVMGGFIFLTGLTLIGILIADLTYGLIDPRAGDPSKREAY